MSGGGCRPHASINYITAHDGCTLHDLVSYNEKQNTANGEGNQDGSNEWEVVLDTRNTTGKHQLRFVSGGKLYELGARSLALFRHRDKPLQRG